jgi:hypothetical protein
LVHGQRRAGLAVHDVWARPLRAHDHLAGKRVEGGEAGCKIRVRALGTNTHLVALGARGLLEERH